MQLQTIKMSNYFELFVTCVDKIGPMLKIWGQTDRVSSMFVEQLLKNTYAQFEREAYAPQLSHLTMGLLCCAKYKDGHYYRAQVTNLRNLISGSIEVKFIDYGNVESITIENIRLLQNVPAGLTSMKAQAVDFILANVIHINRNWDEQALAFIHQEIAYMELKSAIIGAVNHFRFLKVMFHDSDLSDYLIQKGIGLLIPLQTQEMMLRGPTYPVQPFANPAVQRASPLSPGLIQSPVMGTIQEFCTYKTLPLQTNTEHLVYVSYVEDGPYLFSIQLQSMEDVLEKLMIEINQLPLLPLTETPIPGYPCMARCREDNSVCRAVVISLVEDKCKIYYVDFGNTDTLPFANIFQIPFKYIVPKVMSMRFTLAGLKSINVTNDMKCAFKEFVTNKLLKLQVFHLEGSPVLQYCELYEGDINIIYILYESANDYKAIQITKGLKYNIVVSYIEGCKKFYIQLKDSSETLNNLMLNLNTNATAATALQNLEIGIPVLAYYANDCQWYRAQITSLTDTTATVKYVDYGNHDTVTFNCLKNIDPMLVKILPAQAVECCLYGYQNMSFNTEIENVFESLTLECDFSMKVISKQATDALLVDLFDISGNNVAALLIERLAAQKAQISPLPAHQISQSLLNKLAQSPSSEKSFEKSPSRERSGLSWRNAANDKPVEKHNDFGNKKTDYGNERKNWRNKDEKTTWRSTEESPTNDRNTDNWNGDSPTNKRSYAKTDRTNNTRNNNSPSKENKFRSDKFTNDKFNNDKFNNDKYNSDTKRSPPSNREKVSGSDSEKSWSDKSSANRTGKNFNSKRDFNAKPARKDFAKSDFANPEEKFQKRKVELPPQDLAPFETPFQYLEISPNQMETVTISWFYNPESFYCQVLAQQKEFRDQMSEIQTAYLGRPPIGAPIPVGASIIAEFHQDGILYRATILEDKHPKYKVQYVDFGNMSVVDCNKIWQVETKFMRLPIQAIKCGLSGLNPAAETWPVSAVIDNIFNKESFNCVFDGFIDDKYTVQLSENNVDVKQQLIESGVAVDATALAPSLEMADEPIILNILIGQNIRVNLSFIYGLCKFYVQLEKEKANQVQEYVDSFMSTTNITDLQIFPEDQIEIGVTCLTKTVAEKWYRGVVTDKTELSNLKIDHPDLGSSEQKSSNEIYVLPTQLCAFWYQAFECCIHNLSDEVTKLVNDEEFKQNYEGKEVIVYVDEIVNGRLIVTLYDLSGSKIDLIDPEVGAYPTIEPMCPLPVLQPNQQVWVTHIESPTSIYVQLNSHSTKITDLLESLFNFYETTSESPEVEVGAFCCAKSENDGSWYRGRVDSLDDEIANVFYLDYGNSETVHKTNLRSLGPEFHGHELALHISLNLMPIGNGFVDKFMELTTGKMIGVVLSFGDSGWIGEFFDGDLSLNQAMIEAQVVAPIEEVVEPELVDDSRAHIIITHIDSPSEFYAQLLTNNDQIYNLQSDLQERVLQLPDLDGADVGVLCAARYSLDEQWYRAEVLDADSDITTVRFVDYGNTDVINNKSGSIKTLPPDLLAIDKYARKCALNVSPVGEEWAREACEIFEKAIDVQDISADIVYQDEKSKTFVELFVGGVNISLQLLEQNLACSITRDAEDSLANHTGFVSHCNSIAEFWIQLESSVAGLEMIVDRLAAADTFPDLLDLSPGTLCAANFPDDEMWYRARILSNTVAGIEVLFVDYGNSSTALKLKTLPEDLIQIPFLAQKCSLNKPTNLEWSESAINKFKEISADGVTIFTIKKMTAGETSVVELSIDGQNIVEQLRELCDVEIVTPIGQGSPAKESQLVKVYVTHIESPSYFWVQLSSDADQIDEINEALAGASGFAPLANWDSVTTCAALYAETNIWYRANILEFNENYEVLLIDHGKILRTDTLRSLPEQLQTIPPLATLCALELPKETTKWSDVAAERFNSVLSESKCRAEFVEQGVPSIVRLFIDKRNISEEILLETPVEMVKCTNLTAESLSALAENTKLPESAIGTDEDLLEAPDISMYEDCNVTVKDTTFDFDASFTSCADVTSANLESELVELTDKTNESLSEMDDITTEQESQLEDEDTLQESQIENVDTLVLDDTQMEDGTYLIVNNLQIEDTTPEVHDTPVEIRDAVIENQEASSKIRDTLAEIQGILPQSQNKATSESEISTLEVRDTSSEIQHTTSGSEDSTSEVRDSSSDIQHTKFEFEDSTTKIQDASLQECEIENTTSNIQETVVEKLTTLGLLDATSDSEDSTPEFEDTTPEIQATSLETEETFSAIREPSPENRVVTPLTQTLIPEMQATSSKVLDMQGMQDTSSEIVDTALQTEDSPAEVEQDSEDTVSGSEESSIYDNIYQLQNLLLNEMVSIETARQATRSATPETSEKQETPIENFETKVQENLITYPEIGNTFSEINDTPEIQTVRIDNLDTSLDIQDTPQAEDTEVEIEISIKPELKLSRPATPRCDKIVPGSICRGDLDQPSGEEDFEVAESFAQETEFVKRPITRKLSTPHCDKIVPGSICRGDTETPLPPERRPPTPHAEKIVPGSICRGDLNNSVTINRVAEDVVRPMTPKISLDEKLLPGSFTSEDHT